MTSSTNRTIYRRPPIRGGYHNNHSTRLNGKGLINQNQQLFHNEGNPMYTEKSMLKSLSDTFKAFCKETTLHGLKNVIENLNEFETASTR